MEKKNNRGGKRPGSGRKTMNPGKERFGIMLSRKTKEDVQYWAGRLGMSASDYIEEILMMYMDREEHIIRCPHCREPVMFRRKNNEEKIGCRCKYCGEYIEIGE